MPLRKPESEFMIEPDPLEPPVEPVAFSVDVLDQPYPPDGGVYFVRMQDFIKIGVSWSVPRRLAALSTGMPFDIIGLGFIHCENWKQALELEASLHQAFDAHRVRGEWFRLCDEITAHLQEHGQAWPDRCGAGAW